MRSMTERGEGAAKRSEAEGLTQETTAPLVLTGDHTGSPLQNLCTPSVLL